MMLNGDDGRSIQAMLNATGQMRLRRLGKRIPRRLLGVEMRGSASPAKANMLFAAPERRRLRHKERLVIDGFPRLRGTIEEVIAGVRNADDLLLMSGFFVRTAFWLSDNRPTESRCSSRRRSEDRWLDFWTL